MDLEYDLIDTKSGTLIHPFSAATGKWELYTLGFFLSLPNFEIDGEELRDVTVTL